MKSGFVAFVGKPNVGKSSIINALVGEKVSITSPKPQTTRNKILGIVNGENFQLALVDLPGMLKPRNELGKFMARSIESGMEDVDAIVVVMDGMKINSIDFSILEKLKNKKVPVFLAVNKLDTFTFEKVYPELEKMKVFTFVKEIVNVSAKTGKNVDILLDAIVKVLPEGEMFFDKDAITDKSERFLVGEIVREKALLFLEKEIPHGIAVDVTKFEEQKNRVLIDVDIICEKQGHKQIIIGKKGEMLKKIATEARLEIEKLIEMHVFLNCFVKVEPNWRNDKNQLKDIGYDSKDL